MISVEQVLVISPEADHYEMICVAVESCGLGSIYCRKFVEAQSLLVQQKVSVVFCHDTLPDGDFRRVIEAVSPTPLIVLSRFAEWDHYLAALRAGAFDYIAYPSDSAEIERIVCSAIGSSQTLRNGTNAQTKSAMVGTS
jgi:two-component system response regulator PilR (NtrC family)